MILIILRIMQKEITAVALFDNKFIASQALYVLTMQLEIKPQPGGISLPLFKMFVW